MTMWWFFKEKLRRGEAPRVDWYAWLTKGSTIVFASKLADFNFLPDACNRRLDSIQARCRGIYL